MARAEHALRSHHWRSLVQPCELCHNFAARWQCASCKEPYCATCFTQLHVRGACLSHRCVRLGYYTAKIHLRNERLFRANARRLLAKSRSEYARTTQPIMRDRGALVVQRCYRGSCGRLRGQALLQEARVIMWTEQNQRTTISAQNRMKICHIFENQSKVKLVLRRIAFWKCKPAT